jgi:hypothetical protein
MTSSKTRTRSVMRRAAVSSLARRFQLAGKFAFCVDEAGDIAARTGQAGNKTLAHRIGDGNKLNLGGLLDGQVDPACEERIAADHDRACAALDEILYRYADGQYDRLPTLHGLPLGTRRASLPDLARLGLRIGDELGDGRGRNRRMHDHHIRHADYPSSLRVLTRSSLAL